MPLSSSPAAFHALLAFFASAPLALAGCDTYHWTSVMLPEQWSCTVMLSIHHPSQSCSSMKVKLILRALALHISSSAGKHCCYYDC